MKKIILLIFSFLFIFSCEKIVKTDNFNLGKSSAVTNNVILPSDVKTKEKFAANQIIVKFKFGRPDEAFLRAQNSIVKEKILTAAMKHANYSGIHVLYVPDVSKAVEAFKRNPNVEWVNPNWVVKHDAYTPNDPYYTGGNLWGMNSINTSTAWNTNIGDQKVFVGIVDEGIMYWHEDLCGQVWVNPYETDNNGIDDDGNGYIDDINGWDFLHNDKTIFDNADNHGTHVAGTIGGLGNNGKGVIGVSPNVTLISGKFLEGSGYTSDAIKAIDYMTDLKTRHGMNIATTSNSWGGGGFDQGLYDAINRAKAQNILFVAAAGNSGVNTDNSPNYPSCYDLDNIISVAAYASNETLPSWTNYGAVTVDIGAPGVSILSTLPGSGGTSIYDYYSGTSMATPHVSGAVALYKAGNPTATYTEVRNAILNNARPIAALSGKCVTGGVLNVSTFTKATTNQQTARGCVVPNVDNSPPTAPTNVILVSKDSINRTATLTWTPSTDNIGVSKYIVQVDNLWYISSTTVTTNTATVGGVSSGAQYTSRIIAYDAWGNASPTTSFLINLGNDVTPPSTPANFKAVSKDATSVTFSYDWSTDNWSGVGLYRISYRPSSCTTCVWSGWNTNNVNPLTVPNLTTGTQYAFTIAAQDNNRNWSPESPVVLETPGSGTLDLIAPSVPSGLGATATFNSITPYWSASTDNVGVTGYDVYYKLSSASTYSLYGSTTNTLITISGLPSSTSYDIYVKAKDAAGNISAASSVVTKSTEVGPDVTSPTAPTNLVGTPSTNSIALSWSASSDNVGVTGYNVYYKQSSSSTYSLYTTTSSTSTTISGLTSNTSYDMYVTAKDAAGNVSLPSTTLTKSTQSISYSISTTLSGNVSKKTNQILNWNSMITPTGYQISKTELQQNINGVYQTIYTQTTQSLVGSYTNVVNNRFVQSYRVKTTLIDGTVGYSNVVSLTSQVR